MSDDETIEQENYFDETNDEETNNNPEFSTNGGGENEDIAEKMQSQQTRYINQAITSFDKTASYTISSKITNAQKIINSEKIDLLKKRIALISVNDTTDSFSALTLTNLVHDLSEYNELKQNIKKYKIPGSNIDRMYEYTTRIVSNLAMQVSIYMFVLKVFNDYFYNIEIEYDTFSKVVENLKKENASLNNEIIILQEKLAKNNTIQNEPTNNKDDPEIELMNDEDNKEMAEENENEIINTSTVIKNEKDNTALSIKKAPSLSFSLTEEEMAEEEKNEVADNSATTEKQAIAEQLIREKEQKPNYLTGAKILCLNKVSKVILLHPRITRSKFVISLGKIKYASAVNIVRDFDSLCEEGYIISEEGKAITITDKGKEALTISNNQKSQTQ